MNIKRFVRGCEVDYEGTAREDVEAYVPVDKIVSAYNFTKHDENGVAIMYCLITLENGKEYRLDGWFEDIFYGYDDIEVMG